MCSCVHKIAFAHGDVGGFEGLVTSQWEQYPSDDDPFAPNGNGNVLAYYGLVVVDA
jgi:hypothetical protein